jgi:uncharacterized protein
MEFSTVPLDCLGPALDVKHLNLFLFPTEKCNFRCTYCYEDYNIGKMKPDLVNAIKKLLLNRFNDLASLEISWFGGEPLLAKDIIYDLSDFIINNAPKTLKYAANITTNGYYLNKAAFIKLIDSKVNYFQVSFDGDRELHDQSRIRKDKQPTFDVIWKNLIDLKNTNLDFTVLIRVHFTIDNYTQMDDFIEKLNHTFGEDLRFKFFFKPIERLGGENDSSIKTMDRNEKKNIKKILDDKINNRSQVFTFNEISPYICYASVPNSFIIRADGKICKCTVALKDKNNFVGKINEDGEINFNDNFYLWLKGIETLDGPTLACPYNNHIVLNYK